MYDIYSIVRRKVMVGYYVLEATFEDGKSKPVGIAYGRSYGDRWTKGWYAEVLMGDQLQYYHNACGDTLEETLQDLCSSSGHRLNWKRKTQQDERYHVGKLLNELSNAEEFKAKVAA